MDYRSRSRTCNRCSTLALKRPRPVAGFLFRRITMFPISERTGHVQFRLERANQVDEPGQTRRRRATLRVASRGWSRRDREQPRSLGDLNNRVARPRSGACVTEKCARATAIGGPPELIGRNRIVGRSLQPSKSWRCFRNMSTQPHRSRMRLPTGNKHSSRRGIARLPMCTLGERM